MQIEKIQFDDIRYNPEIGAFETLVRVHDGGQGYSYPVRVAAPLHAEYGLIARGLSEAARRAHRRGNPMLRLAHAAPTPQTDTTVQASNSLLDRLFGARAA
ncbi:hypothetical protein [Roseovarius pelagicus]|uniref:KTSC domain-containing protein n=1 Tax=Roseovarius pelagicus TaxID=2980108 RepID=A0ABY6DDY4_9RHOB|nr:hypothetical protein [Roseovarius pelagicus]UXX82025.1 hypothetical protein N7U68_12980 [Roseovarius pelagicus]